MAWAADGPVNVRWRSAKDSARYALGTVFGTGAAEQVSAPLALIGASSAAAFVLLA